VIQRLQQSFRAQLAALDESKNLIVIMWIYREMDVVCEQTGKPIRLPSVFRM
jgi:hypothetical protein